MKEKFVDTNSGKPSIGETTFATNQRSTSFRKTYFAKPYHVNAPGPSRYSSNHVSKTTLKESVGSNDMIHNYYLEEAKKKAQLQKHKALNSKPSVITPARLSNTASGRKLKPSNYNQQTRNWPPSMSSRVTNKAVHIAEKPRNQNPFLKSKDLACPTCKKCIYTANHDACILKYLSKVESLLMLVLGGFPLRSLLKLATTRMIVIWEALRGNTHDLDSIWEDKGQDCKFTRSGFKNMHTMPGDGVTIPSDAVRTYKRQCQETCDDVRNVTALMETLEDSAKRRLQESCDTVATYFLYI
ncbi:hypothetical protein Tco_1121933 [Tanacetum coccineum]|uniref:Uncharacterized protein n=1 Tax=Tanacetum coccineum TaxID=301880 RepID=A0ABQ5J1S7_9ASTR